jgi:hypothetical protein
MSIRNFGSAAFLAFLLLSGAYAQPRPIEKEAAAEAKAKPAPETFDAKYEGGMFGFYDKTEGRLRFDDANERLVFIGKDQKEMFGIPYGSLLVISPETKSVTSTAGNVVSHIPLPGAALGSLMKEKRRYLVIQFNDPDADARGLANFKLDNKELLDSVIETLAEKAKLTRRGDAFYRPRATAPGT